MSGVYCPTCEASVEPAAKFCLSCGNDLTIRGPITATGHDLNQLKDVIRTRDDLSMAEHGQRAIYVPLARSTSYLLQELSLGMLDYV